MELIKKNLRMIVALALIIGIYLGFQITQPIKVPKDFVEKEVNLKEVTTQNEPSLNMTLSHLSKIASKPHASGSLEIEKVRTYLKSQFKEMGYNYLEDDFNLKFMGDLFEYDKDISKKENEAYKKSLKQAFNVKEDNESVFFQNLLVPFEVEKPKGNILVVSHYDSAGDAPGAADDGIGVATMLETMRVIKQEKGIQNNVYFLFTDGEEQALRGAHNFIQTHKDFLKKIDFMINVEARGNAGGVVMFQSSPNSSKLIDLYKNSINNPLAFSIATEIYKKLQNDTDFTEFLEVGTKGINFAAIEGAINYHQMSDNPENLNRNTAYHYLDTMSSTVINSAKADISDIESNRESVFFPIVKGKLVVMSPLTAKLLVVLSLVIAFLWLSFLIFKKHLSLNNWLKTTAISLGIIAGNTVIGFVISTIAKKQAGGEDANDYALWNGAIPFYYVVLGITVVLSVFLTYKVLSKFSKEEVRHSTTILLVVGTMLTSILFPAASYMFSITLLLILIANIVSFVIKDKERDIISIGFDSLAGIIMSCLFIPMTHFVFVALSVAAYPFSALLLSIVLMSILPFILNKNIENN